MKKLLYFLLFTPFFSYGQAGWSVPPGAPIVSRFDDICFIDSMIGYAGGTSVGSTRTGYVFKTSDGGNNWDTVFTISDKYIRSVEFITKDTGFIGTLDTSFYRTTNGGQDWEKINHLIPGFIDGMCGLSRADSNTIYGVGQYAMPPYVIKSTDKGETWTNIDLSAYCGGLIDVKFFSADTGYIVGYGHTDETGIILYTDNGGQTWTVRSNVSFPFSYIWKIDFIDRMNGYASIQRLKNAGPSYFLKTTDGGLTWQEKKISDDATRCFIQGIGFIDHARGWAGGTFAGLFETLDSGNTWTFYNYGKYYDRFCKITDKKAIFSGDKLYTYNSSNVFVKNERENLPEYHCIHSLYPNPVKDQLTVLYEISFKTNVTIGLYDINGKLVKELIRQPKSQGKYEIIADVSALSSGEYMILMKTNERFLCEKFSVIH